MTPAQRMRTLRTLLHRMLRSPFNQCSYRTALKSAGLPKLYKDIEKDYVSGEFKGLRLLDIGTGQTVWEIDKWRCRMGITEFCCWDPNPETEHTDISPILEALAEPVDIVTCSNVICTLPQMQRDEVLLLGALAMKEKTGKFFLSSYPGNRSGVMSISRAGTLQCNQPSLFKWLIRHGMFRCFNRIWRLPYSQCCCLNEGSWDRSLALYKDRLKTAPKVEVVEDHTCAGRSRDR